MLTKVYKLEYTEYVKKYANEYNVDEYLIYAIIKAESNFEPNAESHRGAKGLMQLMYSTAEDISKRIGIELNEDNILEPDININLGTKYISMLIQKYNNISFSLETKAKLVYALLKSNNYPRYLITNNSKKALKIKRKDAEIYFKKISSPSKIHTFLNNNSTSFPNNSSIPFE